MALIGPQLFDANGLASLVADGPIVGAAEPAIRLAPTGYLTTGDLERGDAGDAGNLGGYTFEGWVRFSSATPASTNTIATGPQAHVATRQWSFALLTTGKLRFSMFDTTSTTYTLDSVSTLVANTWYHLVAIYANNVMAICINGVQDTSAAAGVAAWPDLVPGAADLQVGSSGNTLTIDFAELAFYRSGMTASRVLAHYQAGALRGFPSQLASARVGAVLDSVSSTAPRRIGTAVRSLTPRYMTGQSPLDLVKEAVHGEAIDSVFFTASDGTLVFLASDHRSSSPYSTVQATFGDAATEIPYADLAIDYSESFLSNEWNVTREGSAQEPGATVTASDSTSISRYRKRPQSLNGLPVTSDADSSAIAAAMLAKYKDPMQRITGLTFSTVDPAVAEALFRRELMDKITVKRTPPGGGARISQDLYIQKIEIGGSNDGGPWSVTWGVSPL